MSETLSSGLTLTIPTLGDTNWDELIRDQCFLKISEHDHTGGGKGVQLATGAIQDDAITDAKIRLTNTGWLTGRNAANSADVNIIRVNSSDVVELNVSTSTWTPSYGGSGGMSFSGSTTFARYLVLGKWHIVSVYFTGTTSGAGAAYLTMTLPATVKTSTDGEVAACSVVNSGSATAEYGRIYMQQNTTTARWYRAADANWTIGAGVSCFANFIYEAN